MRTDRISKPQKDRYFPIEYKEITHLIKNCSFNVFSYHKRIPIFLENCLFECKKGHQLASFIRKGYISTFSLPLSINSIMGSNALQKAIEKFSDIDKGPELKVKQEQLVIYRAYLNNDGQITITQHILNSTDNWYLKYKDAAKISKSQEKHIKETIISQYKLG